MAPAKKKTVKIFGATGTVGQACLSIIEKFPEQFTLCGLSANQQDDALAQLKDKFHPSLCVVASEEGKNHAGLSYGQQAMQDLAQLPADICVIAISASAGLRWAIQSLPYCQRLALANKESLVMGGDLLRTMSQQHKVEILPIDSEHTALFQLLDIIPRRDVKSITLTASGGPFWNTPYEELAKASPKQALQHPVWGMGDKITIDSATFMNKGLEVIEAYHLFAFPQEQIKVVVHPQAMVHAFVETIDQQTFMHASLPDMRACVLSALTWPQRYTSPLPGWDTTCATTWQFFPPDTRRFPCLALAREALKQGNRACITLNAANEASVAAFLNEQIAWNDIPMLIRKSLERDFCAGSSLECLEDIMNVHHTVYHNVKQWITQPKKMIFSNKQH